GRVERCLNVGDGGPAGGEDLLTVAVHRCPRRSLVWHSQRTPTGVPQAFRPRGAASRPSTFAASAVSASSWPFSCFAYRVSPARRAAVNLACVSRRRFATMARPLSAWTGRAGVDGSVRAGRDSARNTGAATSARASDGPTPPAWTRDRSARITGAYN